MKCDPLSYSRIQSNKGNYLATYESLLNLNSFAFMSMLHFYSCSPCSGQMISVTDPGSSGPGSSPARRHCVVFLDKTLYSPRASLFRAGNAVSMREFWLCARLQVWKNGGIFVDRLKNTVKRASIWKPCSIKIWVYIDPLRFCSKSL